MANTLTTMQARIFADSAIKKLNDFLLPLSSFSTSFSSAAAQKGDTVRVPVFPTSTSAASFNGDYSGTDRTITGVDISLNNHYFDSVAFTDRELAESPADYFGEMGAQLGKSIAKTVLTNVLGTITAANYGNAAGDKLVVAGGSVTVADLITVRQKLAAKGVHASDATLVLGLDYYATILGSSTLLANNFGGAEAVRTGKIPSLYGFKNVIESNIVPTNSENLGSFACAPQAIGVAMRYLAPQSTTGLIDAGMVTDDESGVTLGVRVIPAPLNGKVHYVVEALWGKSKVDGSALVRVLSA